MARSKQFHTEYYPQLRRLEQRHRQGTNKNEKRLPVFKLGVFECLVRCHGIPGRLRRVWRRIIACSLDAVGCVVGVVQRLVPGSSAGRQRAALHAGGGSGAREPYRGAALPPAKQKRPVRAGQDQWMFSATILAHTTHAESRPFKIFVLFER